MLWKQRPDGPVYQPGRQGFFFTGTANFAAKIVARNSAGSINFLLIFDGKGQKAGRSFIVGGYCGHQDDGVAILDHNRPGCLFGNLAGLNAHSFSADFFFKQIFHVVS